MPEQIDQLAKALSDRYRLERELGEGGMATVFLATDLKHDRQVALKVLKPELAAVLGAERFLQEIKTTANLQHPHILPLFDSGEADGNLYYVMPFIEGETLRAKLDRETQLGVDEAIAIATDVADALSYAHRHDVIHRDIKPENILLHDGRPVVADFGIALAVSAAAGGRMTETGLSLGTPHYMSPEQATAEKDLTDKSDQYSLGTVAYEMLTGDPPHTGPSAQAIVMRILTEDPRPLLDVRRSVPPNVAAAVMRSVEKLPADRFESMESFKEALSDTTFSYSSARTSTQNIAALQSATTGASWLSDTRSRVAVGAIGLLVVGLAYAGLSGGASAPPEPEPVTRFTVDVGEIEHRGHVAISPDGSMVVFNGFIPGGGPSQLWRRLAESVYVEAIPDTPQASSPVFSPDGAWIAFVVDQEIRKVPADGGRASVVAQLEEEIESLDWGADGTMVIASNRGLLWRVSADGGDPQRILMSGEITETTSLPRLMPDGSALLFTEGRPDLEGSEVRLLDLESGEVSTVLSDASDARYVEPGLLLYATLDQALFAVTFDAASRTITGPVTPVLDDVMVTPLTGRAVYALATNGTIAYLTGDVPPAQERVLVEVDQAGRERSLRLPPSAYYGVPRWSHDGRRLVWQQDVGDIWTYDRVTGARDRIAGGGGHFNPIWNADGTGVIYGSRTHEATVISLRLLDSEDDTEVLLSRPALDFALPWTVTADGKILVYGEGSGQDNDANLMLLDLATKESRPYLRADWGEVALSLSPDGRWAAYESNEEGAKHIYVRSFPEPGEAVRISEGRGIGARWGPDGNRLYYRSGDTVFVARVRTGEDFALQSTGVLYVGTTTGLDPHPDGEHFVVAKAILPDSAVVEALREPEMVMVVNWQEELARRVGESGDR